MPKRDPDPELRGVFDTAESIRDFDDFPKYLEGWLKRNVLPDLFTVFEGARRYWDAKKMPDGSSGRGDFILAAPLFLVLDHLGSLLTKSDDEWITPSENLSRAAQHLPSLQDIVAVAANMGRNALIHIAWPQTAIPMHRHSWAFGLTFSANSNLKRQNNLYITDWFPRGKNGPKKIALKLKLNVHALLVELQHWLEHPGTASSVRDPAFERIQLLSAVAGDPHPGASQEYHRLIHAGQSIFNRKVKPICTWDIMRDQINSLYDESWRVGAWNTKRVPVARDFAGIAEPTIEHDQKEKSIMAMLQKAMQDR